MVMVTVAASALVLRVECGHAYHSPGKLGADKDSKNGFRLLIWTQNVQLLHAAGTTQIVAVL